MVGTKWSCVGYRLCAANPASWFVLNWILRLKTDLPGRPAELPPTQQVQMQVKNRLPCSFAVVQHSSVACKQLAFARQVRRHKLEFSKDYLILGARICQRLEVLPWANQDVCRRLRADVLECEEVLVLINELRWNLLRPNLAKEAVGAHRAPPAGVSGSNRVTNVSKPSRERNCSPNCRAPSSPEILPTRTR